MGPAYVGLSITAPLLYGRYCLLKYAAWDCWSTSFSYIFGEGIAFPQTNEKFWNKKRHTVEIKFLPSDITLTLIDVNRRFHGDRVAFFYFKEKK